MIEIGLKEMFAKTLSVEILGKNLNEIVFIYIFHILGMFSYF